MASRIRQGVLCGAALLWIAPLTAKAVVIYQDSFTAGTAGTAIGGNALPVDSGLDGGTLNATWQANTVTASNPDAVWLYSSAGAVITSPNGTANRDTSLIADAFLPFTPQAGFVYDLESTMTVPQATGDNGHWSGLTFASYENGGTGGGAAALSNCGPTGLVIDRDDLSNTYVVNIFEGPGGGTSGQYNASSPSTPGTTTTFDIILNTMNGLSAETMSWEINGVPAGGPVSLSGNPAINYVAFGDDTAPTTTVSNFSLTASVPEPASLGVIGLGALGLLRRRARNA